MARWFPSGLSAISGQISNFTKEVLAEGIEEIDDHATELRNAKARIRDLEAAAAAQRAEMERLHQLNDELSVELHSHELQKVHLSDKFQAELAKKEEELKTLRQQQADYIDHVQRLSAHDAHQVTPVSNASSSHNADGDREIHQEDFGDIISSQQEINRLRADVRRLTIEVQHWRRVASDLQAGALDKPGTDRASNTVLVAELQAEIQELRRSMSEAVDQHQRQLSSLHDVHRQTIASLKTSHSKSVEQLHKQLAALKLSASGDQTSESTELSRLREQLSQAETMRLKLEYDLEHTHAADNKKTQVIAELTQKLKKYEDESNKVALLQSQVDSYRQELEQFEAIRYDWQMEKGSLEEVLMKLRLELKTRDEKLNATDVRKDLFSPIKCSSPMKGSSQPAEAGNSSQASLMDGDDDDDDDEFQSVAGPEAADVEVPAVKQAMDEELASQLTAQTNRLPEELDNQQHVAENLELQLQEACGIIDEMKLETEELRIELSDKSSQLDRAKTELGEKTAELNSLKSDNSQLEEQLNAGNVLVRNLEVQLHKSTVLLNEQKAVAGEEQLRLEKVVSERKEKADRLSAENHELEKSIEMLDAQQQDAVQQLIASRDSIAADNHDLTLRLAAQTKASDTDNNRIDRSEAEPAETVSTANSCLLSEIAQASASDAMNLVEEDECAQLECDLVLSRAETEQSSDADSQLKASRAELLRLQLMMTEREKSYNDHIAQLSAELSSCQDAECRDCSSKAQVIDELNTETRLLEDHRRQLLRDLDSCQGQLEDEQRRYKAEVRQLSQQVEELQTQLWQANEQPAAVANSLDDDAATALRTEMESLKESLDEKESVCHLYELEVQRLTGVEEQLMKEVERQQEIISKLPEDNELKEKMEENCKLRQEVDELCGQLEQLQQKLVESVEVNGSPCSSSHRDLSNGRRQTLPEVNLNTANSGAVSSAEPRNGDTSHQLDSHVIDDSKDISHLRSTISQQKDMLDALNSKYASLRSLLEDRSQAVHGSSVLSDVHRLESELREVRADRERLLMVLGEKTREASGLRGEVHRLTSVAAASQAALTKAQRDTQLIASQSQQETNQDMKNEAVKKLSQIIKDKDVEIDALQLKNATLVQVVQDSAPDGAKLVAVCAESDSLKSQLQMYQHDREQLISALTAKHQESVGFYEEARHLSAQVAQLRNDAERLTRECDSHLQQYEEKQQALFAALGEVAALRQRRSELEGQLSAATRLSVKASSSDVQSLTDRDSNTTTGASSAMINDLQLEIQRCRDLLAEKDLALQKRERCISDLETSVKSVGEELEMERQKCCDVATRLRSSEELLSSRTTELLALKKQCDSLTFQLQNSSTHQSELISERDSLLQRSKSLSTELQTLQAAHSELTATVGSREFELNAFREQVASMQRLMESGQAIGSEAERHGEELKMLRDQLETVRQQAMSLQHERDQACLALQQQQAESTQLRSEIMRFNEKEQRLVKECDRLRGHLVQIEDSYTREALEAEDREKQLRNKLAAVEEKMLTSSSAMQTAKLDSAKQLESLQLQLHVIAEQRDNALLQLSSAQETISSYALSLSNLQMVLEQFQAERQEQQSLEIERYKRDWQHERDESDQLRQQLQQLQVELADAGTALDAAHRLSEQLDRKEAMIAALRDEVHLREAELAKAEEQLNKMTSSTDAKIDKIIIKNLLLGYFHTPPSKRHEALQVIGQVLSYSRDEMKEITTLNKHSEGGWLGGLFRKKSSTTQSAASVAGNPYRSFSELFVNFLERESTPQPSPARLPAERMVQEQQLKQQQQRRATPTFNPFSTSILNPAPALTSVFPVTDFAVADARSDPFHPLMRPISPAHVPILAPASDRSTDTPPVVSGRDSANSSGRSTPSAPSAIIRDLLQQQ